VPHMGYTTGLTAQTSALMSGLPETVPKTAVSEAEPIQPVDEFAPPFTVSSPADASRFAL